MISVFADKAALIIVAGMVWFFTGFIHFGSSNKLMAGENAVLRAGESVFRLMSAAEISVVLEDFDQDMIMESPIGGLYGIVLDESLRNTLIGMGHDLFMDEEIEVLIIFRYNNSFFIPYSHGSGYIVSEQGHVVSNDHVINSGDYQIETQGLDLVTFLVMGIQPRLSLARVEPIWGDMDKDLALGKVVGISARPLVFAHKETIKTTQRVYSIGFPGASDDLTVGGGLGDPIGFMLPKFGEGTLKGTYQALNDIKVWEHHAPISGGNSGGPLVNICGEVVGTNFAMHIESQHTLLAVALEELLPELRRLGINFQQATSACALTAASMDMRLIYLLTVLLVLSLCSGTFFLLRLRQQVRDGLSLKTSSVLIRKLAGAEKEQSESESDESKWKQDDHGRYYCYDPVLGVIFKDETDDKPSSEIKSEAPKLSITLSSLNGLEDIVVVQGQPVIIGRDPSQARIVIDNTVISGKHACLTYDGQYLVVEDLQSTNETFLNGRSIHKPEKMKNGDVLQLSPKKGIAEYVIKGTGLKTIAVLRPVTRGLPEIPLKAGDHLTIGRAPGNQVIIDDSHISAVHCHVSVGFDGKVTVEDNQTGNGTFINSFDNKISKATLDPGQKLCLAYKDIVYKLEKKRNGQ